MRWSRCRGHAQSVPQWLWSTVLQGVTCAVTKATSLHEAAANISQLPPCFTSALLPNVRVSRNIPVYSVTWLAAHAARSQLEQTPCASYLIVHAALEMSTAHAPVCRLEQDVVRLNVCVNSM